MMLKRTFVVFVFGIAFCHVWGQSEAISLGMAQAIDLHVIDVEWQPAGKALLYRRQEEKGFSLGLYKVGGFEGKVILPISKDETWQTYWLADSNAALLVVRTPGKAKSVQIRIYLADADTMSAKQLYSQSFEEKFVPGVDIDPSPTLRHAIVTLRNSTGTVHKVLTLGGGNFTDSPDLDKADKEGLSGPVWSVDGTAIYSNSRGDGSRTSARSVLAYELAKSSEKDGQGSGDSATSIKGTITISGNDTAITNFSTQLSIYLKFSPPVPKTGTNVLELMPANPILRPVRFRGAWEDAKKEGPKLIPQTHPILLQFDRSNQQDTSVWLTRGTGKGTPATLVAVHVTDTWLAESKNSIAYTIDGALFFRSVGN